MSKKSRAPKVRRSYEQIEEEWFNGTLDKYNEIYKGNDAHDSQR